MIMSIQERIDRFRDDLLELSVPIMVQKHITYGDCFALDQMRYFDLKAEVSNEFKIHPSQVLMVGSGKLGFSIVNDKRYRPFGDTSDIDIALVCHTLFDKIWLDVFNYKQDGSYWPEFDKFRKYLFKGWIRPDKLPPAQMFEFSRHWWEFFRSITSSSRYGSYQIRAGLYKSWYYLESYQSQCVIECKNT